MPVRLPCSLKKTHVGFLERIVEKVDVYAFSRRLIMFLFFNADTHVSLGYDLEQACSVNILADFVFCVAVVDACMLLRNMFSEPIVSC